MMQMKLITDPQQYFQVISTGKIESMYEGEMSELLLIKSENEQMMEGQSVITSPLDKHQMHIMEHRAVLADPELRKDRTLVQVVLNHVKEHLDFLRSTDPALLGLIGEQPVPPLQGTPPSPDNMQMQMPPQGSLSNNPIAPEMGPPGGGQVPPGEVPGPGQKGIPIAQPARPPGPFKNLPTNPAEMAPPTG